MGLPGAHGVEGLVVNGPARGTVMLHGDVHPALPLHQGVEGHPLQDAQLDFPVEARLHGLLPVEGNRGWDVDRGWRGLWVDPQLQGGGSTASWCSQTLNEEKV